MVTVVLALSHVYFQQSVLTEDTDVTAQRPAVDTVKGVGTLMDTARTDVLSATRETDVLRVSSD